MHVLMVRRLGLVQKCCLYHMCVFIIFYCFIVFLYWIDTMSKLKPIIAYNKCALFLAFNVIYHNRIKQSECIYRLSITCACVHNVYICTIHGPKWLLDFLSYQAVKYLRAWSESNLSMYNTKYGLIGHSYVNGLFV